jgi:putative ABC transport system substrate-binding protein
VREAVPGLSRLAVLFNADNPAPALDTREVQAAARTLGLEVVPAEVRRTEEITSAVEALKGRADALYVAIDPLLNTSRAQISASALQARLPAISGFRDWVTAGSLMSYGPDISAAFGRAAELVDKILRGTKPADIPVEQPTKFELVINLKTAEALGLTVPTALLVRADEVIE